MSQPQRRTTIFQLLRRYVLQLAVVAVLVVVMVVSYNLGASGNDTSAAAPATTTDTPASAEQSIIWTCSMHPNIRMQEPGLCPLCAMDLIPMAADAAAEGGAPRLAMTSGAVALAEIQTTPVERQWVENQVRMVGFVDYDETRLVNVSAYVGGRLERLYVDYTGIQVRQGEHMVELYSPELLTAQEELLQAKRVLENPAQATSAMFQDSARRTLEGARERLRLWGLSPDQIREIENQGTRRERLTINAPRGGIVIQKWINEGEYVETGQRIYTIADLSRLWVKLRAYESDLAWLRYGQDVEFITEAYPGEVFHGRISFINPTMDQMTRTVMVRVNVENEDSRLKPGMFVRAVVKARVARGGRVIDPSLAGKWMCPMHPEVVRETKDDCPLCGMDLVLAEDLGFVASVEGTPPLVVPASAVLLTGRRAVVYVKVPDSEQPMFEGRVVRIGPRAADHYVVLEGLQEGEEVVTNGAFKIDSSLQIIAKPAMMDQYGADSTEEESAAPTISASAAFLRQLSSLYDAYFALQTALAEDSHERAVESFRKFATAAAELDSLPDAHRPGIHDVLSLASLQEAAQAGAESGDIGVARQHFQTVSNIIVTIAERIGHAGTTDHFLVHCPMAFEFAGADWLQRDDAVYNPYFGDEMLRCGTVKKSYEPLAAK